jgi:hypothetical protein
MKARMRRGHIKSPPLKKRSFNENSIGWEDAAASASRSKARNLNLRNRLIKLERFPVDFDGYLVNLARRSKKGILQSPLLASLKKK